MSGLASGQRFGDFEILEVAGEGGMGVIYRASQVSLGRVVALKVIAPLIGNDPDYRARFGRESRTAAAVDHPNVVTVYEAGEVEGELYLALQWIDGPDLKAVISEQGALSPERAIDIARQLAGALHAVHAVGLMHRDVKPANILLRSTDEGDHPFLADFGIAKVSSGATGITRTGMWVGTHGYVAPELVSGEQGDGRSDLYSLGCVLFELLTGEPVFTAGHDAALMLAHTNEERPLPSERRPALGDRFDSVVTRMLAIDPDERFQTGAEFARALVSLPPDVPPPDALAATVPGPPLPPTMRPGPVLAPTPPQPAPVAGPPQEQATPATPPLPAPVAGPPQEQATPVTPPIPPPPAAAAQGQTARTVGLVLLAVLAVAAAALVAFAATGGFSGEEKEPASQPVDSKPAPKSDDGGGDKAAAQSEVVSVLQQYAAAYTKRDTGALGTLFSGSVARRGLAAGGCRTVTGRDAVLQTYEEQFAQGTGSYDLPDLSAADVRIDGSAASVPTTRYTISPGGTGTIRFSLVEEESGWLISRVFASC